MKIEVTISTFNRAESLGNTLKSMKQLLIPSAVSWRLRVVDNNSTDDTRNVIQSFADFLPVTYLAEKKQGLSYGRNRAIAEFSSDVLVFTDDDVIVDPGWLMAYAEAFERNPDIGYGGGPIQPYWVGPRPSWLVDESMPVIAGLLGYYSLGGDDKLFVSSDMHPFGANFALSRKVIEQVGLFRTDLGVAGDVPGRGEEAEYFKRIAAAGFRGQYVAKARVQHKVDPGHLKLGYLYRYGIEKGIAHTRMGETGLVPGLSSYLSYAIKGGWQLIKGRGDRFRQCVINMGIVRGIRRSKSVNGARA